MYIATEGFAYTSPRTERLHLDHAEGTTNAVSSAMERDVL